MALGLYKPGQGYWVRVLTAAFAGVILLSAGMWLWSELGNLATRLPAQRHVVSLTGVSGDLAPGQRINLLAQPPSSGAAPAVLGTAEVISAEKTGAEGAQTMRLVIGPFARNADARFESVHSIAPAPGSAATATGTVTLKLSERAIEPLYVQAGGVTLLAIFGAVAVYWLVGARRDSVDFLIATDGEMKKVNWTTRKDIIASTWVVIVWAFLISAGLFIVDLGFSTFFKLIGILEQ